jgi:hypothetical protein
MVLLDVFSPVIGQLYLARKIWAIKTEHLVCFAEPNIHKADQMKSDAGNFLSFPERAKSNKARKPGGWEARSQEQRAKGKVKPGTLMKL